MRILQARFTGARASITIDDDSDSDDAIDAKASVPEQKGICDIGDVGKDVDEDSYYNHDKDIYVCPGGYSEEADDLDTPHRFPGDGVCDASIKPVLNISRAYLLSILYILSCCFSLYHILPLFHRLPTPSRVQTLLLLLLVLCRMPERYLSFASHVLLEFA